MLAIFKREFKAFMQSAIGYVFMGIYLLVSGVYFSMYNVLSVSADIGSMLSNMEFVFMILVPILTMKLLSDERRSKTDQLLLTSPVSLWSIVLGKFFAACAVFLLTLVITFSYVVIIDIFGTPAYNEVIAGYFGFFLLGCALISVGVFTSAVTESQVTSAVLCFGMMLFLTFAGMMSSMMSTGLGAILGKVISIMDPYSRYTNFANGIISVSDVVYLLSFAGVFLFLTERVIEKRRWSEG